MNEVGFGGQRSPYESEGMYPASPTVQNAVVNSQELAQQVLMGMQQDIEAQIDWRLSKAEPKTRGFAPSEMAVVLGSLGCGVPLLAIAAASSGLAGIIVVCVMLISVNGIWFSMTDHTS